MTMLGSTSIEKRFIRWSKADFDAYLTAAAIGVLAGLAVSYIRPPLHLPGHKVLLWMIPALGCRLGTRARAGASTSVLATIFATLLLGGRLGGGFLMMPLVALAGITLDIAAGMVERRRSPWSLPLLALAGATGNLLCFMKRLCDPMPGFFSSGNMRDLLWAAASHIFFGLLAGVIGGLCGWGLLTYRRRREISD